MCAIAKCNGIWVAIHGNSKLILAVGGRGAGGKKRAHAEAKKRQKKYGPPGKIPVLKDPNCKPMLDEGPAARRIRGKMSCLKKGGSTEKCVVQPSKKKK